MYRLFLLTVAITMVSACGNDTVETLKNLEDVEFAEIMEKASQDAYDPPENGQLIEEQLKMYISVKKHEAELHKGEIDKVKEKVSEAQQSEEESVSGVLKRLEAMNEVASYMTLDIRAAQELNVNTAEFEWVRNTLMDTSSNAMIASFKQTNKPMLDRIATVIPDLEKERDKTTDPQAKEILDQQIENTKIQLNELKNSMEKEALSPEDKHNLALYNQYKDEIKLYETEVDKLKQITQ